MTIFSVGDKNNKEVKRLADKITSLLDRYPLEKEYAITRKLNTNSYYFLQNEEAVDQAFLNEIKKELEHFYDFAEKEDQSYKIYYGNPRIISGNFLFLKHFDIKPDDTLPLKLEKLMENDKLSFINFVESLENCLCPDILGMIDKALNYGDELGIHDIHQKRMELMYFKVVILLQTNNLSKLRAGLESAQAFIEYFKERQEKPKESIAKVYAVYLYYAFNLEPPDLFLEAVEHFLELAEELNSHWEEVCDFVDKSLPHLIETNQLIKAKKFANIAIKFSKKLEMNKEIYYVALKNLLNVMAVSQDMVEFFPMLK